MVATDSWETFDEGLFTIQLPSIYGAPEREASDSYSASWESEAGRVSYEWSPYVPDLSQLDRVDSGVLVPCDAGPLTADGFSLTRTEEGSSGLLVAATWTELVGSMSLGSERLQLVVEPLAPGGLAEAVTIISTVSIRHPAVRGEWPGKLGIVVCPDGGADEACVFVPSGTDTTGGG